MGKLSTEEADRLVKAKKLVSASVSWKTSNNNSWRLEAKAVELETQEILSIKCYIGKDNYSFALLYKNYPIRKYTKHQRHKFNGTVYDEPHKHTWDTEYGDKQVYIPKDIDPGASIDQQFFSFCNECNIELIGGYQQRLLE